MATLKRNNRQIRACHCPHWFFTFEWWKLMVYLVIFRNSDFHGVKSWMFIFLHPSPCFLNNKMFAVTHIILCTFMIICILLYYILYCTVYVLYIVYKYFILMIHVTHFTDSFDSCYWFIWFTLLIYLTHFTHPFDSLNWFIWLTLLIYLEKGTKWQHRLNMYLQCSEKHIWNESDRQANFNITRWVVCNTIKKRMQLH